MNGNGQPMRRYQVLCSFSDVGDAEPRVIRHDQGYDDVADAVAKLDELVAKNRDKGFYRSFLVVDAYMPWDGKAIRWVANQ